MSDKKVLLIMHFMPTHNKVTGCGTMEYSQIIMGVFDTPLTMQVIEGIPDEWPSRELNDDTDENQIFCPWCSESKLLEEHRILFHIICNGDKDAYLDKLR